MSSKIKDDDLAVHANVLLRLKYPVILALLLNLGFVIRVPFAQSKDTVVAHNAPADATTTAENPELPADGDPPGTPDNPPGPGDPPVPNPFIVVSPAPRGGAAPAVADPPVVRPPVVHPPVDAAPPALPVVDPAPPVTTRIPTDPPVPDVVPAITPVPPVVVDPPVINDPPPFVAPAFPEAAGSGFSERLIRIARGLVDESVPRAPSPFGSPTHAPVDPAPAVTPPVASANELVLVNPPETGGVVHFLVDGRFYSLYPGESTRLLHQAEWAIEFHRGGAFGDITLRYGSGVYRFAVGRERGWTLTRSAP